MKFYKYQGAGNDFIIIDNRNNTFTYPEVIIKSLCNRHFGIGADGLMLLENDAVGNDFYMRYFNADGNEGTMCGNGGRCLAAFANHLGIGSNILTFNSVDGLHTAEILEKKGNSYSIKLKMADVPQVHEDDGFYYLNTGSPHHIGFVNKLKDLDVVNEGRCIRNSEMYAPDGTNVNFVELLDNELFVRTYERGVENETLACGTGATAAAIAAALYTQSGKNVYTIKTIGGTLKVSFEPADDGSFRDIYLEGPAALVFEGEIAIED